MITPANEAGNISTHPNEPKTRNSPSRGAKQHSHELNGFGDTTNLSSGCRDSHSVGNDMGTAANEMEIVRMCQNSAKSQHPGPPVDGEELALMHQLCVLLNVPITVPS